MIIDVIVIMLIIELFIVIGLVGFHWFSKSYMSSTTGFGNRTLVLTVSGTSIETVFYVTLSRL